ncbi:MAG: YkgJ family cysteine cluster protein [Vampirovibrionales bacterium]|nr:YkgJ family cysteine cluster protein [Vampirovibrionales bacterium]
MPTTDVYPEKAAMRPAPQPQNAFERQFNLPRPKCCSTGDCCKGVSPSTPTRVLKQRLAEKQACGDTDDFAATFFSIMRPYDTHQAAHAEVPGVVAATLAAAQKNPAFENDEADVIFYRCKFLQADNRCGVHEDRPDFCRDYPDTPFLVMAPNCAYLPWAKACKAQYAQLQVDATESAEALHTLKTLQQHSQSGSSLTAEWLTDTLTTDEQHTLLDANWPWIIALTRLWVGSPMGNLWF